MQKTDSLYTFVVGGGAASVAFLLGGVDHLIVALAIFMAADYLTGLIVSLAEKSTDSRIAFRGLLKKGAMLTLVIISHQLDIVAGSVDSHFLRNAMIMFLIAVEGISIVENMGRLGVPVPAFLRDRLEQMKNESEGDKNAKGD